MRLSQVYDDILSDFESTEIFYQQIKKDLQEPILECACGSGDLLQLMQHDFSDVLGLDADAEMLNLAQEKGCHSLIHMNMLELDSLQSFKTIICVGDSLNYLNLEQVEMFFKAAYSNLEVGGLLIFDMHHTSRLAEFEEPFIEEADMGDYQYQWSIVSSDSQLFHHFVFYLDDDTMSETIVQTVFDEDKIEQIIKNLGFYKQAKQIDEDLEKITYIYKKKEKI